MEEKKKSNLKIIIFIIIAIVLIIAVVIMIIPKGKMSKEKMLEIAEDYTGRDDTNHSKTNIYFIDLTDNMASAETKKGNIYKVEDLIGNIGKDYCEFDYGATKVRMYLATDTLSKLKENQKICVVGQLTNIEEVAQMIMGMSYNETIFELKNCYLIEE